MLTYTCWSDSLSDNSFSIMSFAGQIIPSVKFPNVKLLLCKLNHDPSHLYTSGIEDLYLGRKVEGLYNAPLHALHKRPSYCTQ
jgi:hypothetical protein